MEDPRSKFSARKIYRGSQVIYGERTHLLEVLRSVRRTRLPRPRKQAEVKQLRKLIAARTQELNRISPGWERRIKRARDAKTSPSALLRMALTLAADDYLLARALTEHPQAPAQLLEHLARHPYSAVRENVARHPHTPEAVLRRMAEDPAESLWFLVAFNPGTPPDLRERLRAKIQQGGGTPT